MMCTRIYEGKVFINCSNDRLTFYTVESVNCAQWVIGHIHIIMLFNLTK